MLNDFFRINMPYGVAKNENNEWVAFNREYLPLGFNDTNLKKRPGEDYQGYPIYTKYKGLTEKLLIKLAWGEKGIIRNEKGEIKTIFFYNDGTNPQNQSKDKVYLWEAYFEKIKTISKLKKQD